MKKIKSPIRLGQILQETRIKLGMNSVVFSAKTRISEKYLEAIENNHFDKLPSARAHRLAYIRACASALQLDQKKIIRQFVQENGLKNADTKMAIAKHKTLANLSYGIRYLVVGIFAVFFIGYLGWQIKGIITPPILNIYSPNEGSVATNSETTIEGQTERECRLTINGQNVQVDESGRFSSIINLAVGVNTINFSSTKKHGKTTMVTRHIIVKESQKTASLSAVNNDPSEKTW